MIVEERRLRIPGRKDRIVAACDFVVEAARHAGLDERGVHHCQLAVDEACTNVIEHGYGVDAAEEAIDIICRKEGNRFSITVSDDSPEFDPLRRADPDPTKTLDNREPGGWGIYFIKKVMDEVFYWYEAHRNCLVMVKHLNRATPTEENAKAPSAISVSALANHVWSVAPHGRLDSDTCPVLETILSEKIAAGHKRLVIDLADVDYLSSSGLKMLVSLWQRAREAKGEIVLAALNTRVREVLQIIGLDLVFTIHDTPQDAAAAFVSR